MFTVGAARASSLLKTSPTTSQTFGAKKRETERERQRRERRRKRRRKKGTERRGEKAGRKGGQASRPAPSVALGRAVAAAPPAPGPGSGASPVITGPQGGAADVWTPELPEVTPRVISAAPPRPAPEPRPCTRLRLLLAPLAPPWPWLAALGPSAPHGRALRSLSRAVPRATPRAGRNAPDLDASARLSLARPSPCRMLHGEGTRQG